MKINELPRFKIRFKGEVIGLSDTADHAIRDMQQVMGYEAYINGYAEVPHFDVFDSKTDCIIAKSRDYDPLPIV